MTAVFHLLMTWLRVFLDGLVAGVLRDGVVKSSAAGAPCSLASPAGTSRATASPQASDRHAGKSSLWSLRVPSNTLLLQPRAPLTTDAASILDTSSAAAVCHCDARTKVKMHVAASRERLHPVTTRARNGHRSMTRPLVWHDSPRSTAPRVLGPLSLWERAGVRVTSATGVQSRYRVSQTRLRNRPSRRHLVTAPFCNSL